MIMPAEIPQIPGDLEQLLGHAAGLRVTGPALAQTASAADSMTDPSRHAAGKSRRFSFAIRPPG